MKLDFSHPKEIALGNVQHTINRLERVNIERHRGDGDPMHTKAIAFLAELRQKRDAILAISDEEWQGRQERERAMFSADFVDQVVALALQIAKRARNEDHLQDINIIFDKFNHELEELDEADNKWDEIPDVVYYAALAAAQGSPHLLRAMPHRLKTYSISVEQAKAACLAKYRLRAAGEPKNIEKERAAIMAAISESKEAERERR